MSKYHISYNLEVSQTDSAPEAERLKYMDRYQATGEDFLIANQTIRAQLINSSTDPLFALLKKPLNLDEVFSDSNQIHISLSNDGSLAFIAMWAAARLIMQKHHNVQFHLLTLEIANQWGDELLSKFDGFLNPGGIDSFPKHLEEFNDSECNHILDIEKTYIFIVNKSYELKIPYFGICSGLQHLALMHGSHLQPVKGYSKAQHEVFYIPATFSYFQALNTIEQKNALENCELPDVSFTVDTYNNYAAIRTKLGSNLELGAISKEGVAMAYSHQSGIRYGTQYHPEHSYVTKNINSFYPELLFDNFIALATLHHDHRVYNKTHPIEHFATVKVRLEECLESPTCLIRDEVPQANLEV